MIGDLFSKLKEARQKIEESKSKLNDIIVESGNSDGSIQIKANANKVITSIEISEDFLKSCSKEAIQEQLLTALNKALDEAAQKGEAEMKEITKDMLPNFPSISRSDLRVVL
jgi:DNA-binding protein YbaB